MALSDRIALLRGGALEQIASPREIYGRPATAYAAQFIGQTNLLEAEVRDGLGCLRGRCAGRAADRTAPHFFPCAPKPSPTRKQMRCDLPMLSLFAAPFASNSMAAQTKLWKSPAAKIKRCAYAFPPPVRSVANRNFIFLPPTPCA